MLQIVVPLLSDTEIPKEIDFTGMEDKGTYGVSVLHELNEMMNSVRKKIMVLSAVSQTEKDKQHMISLICRI